MTVDQGRCFCPEGFYLNITDPLNVSCSSKIRKPIIFKNVMGIVKLVQDRVHSTVLYAQILIKLFLHKEHVAVLVVNFGMKH
jgi:hypothetical protein